MSESSILKQSTGFRWESREWPKIILVILILIMPIPNAAAEGTQDDTGGLGASARISINSPLEIRRPVISLGDMATFSGMSEDMVASLSGIEVGKAPSPGHARTLSLAIVKVRLRQAGYDPNKIAISGPVTIMVSTRPAVVTSEDVTEAVEEYVKANMPWNPGETRISVTSVGDRILVPDGDIQVKVETLSTTKFLGTTAVKAQILVDGEVAKTFHVRVRVDVAKEVVVAAETIQRHEIISEGDLSLEVYDLCNVPSDVAFDPLLVVGMRAKHTIQAGRPVAFSSIQCPPVIARGDLVTLEAMAGGVIVAIPGEALEAGAVGDLIRVKNTSSGAIVRARVIDSQRVQGI
jgi:flagella basal body P-ring formation protein FlgA